MMEKKLTCCIFLKQDARGVLAHEYDLMMTKVYIRE